MSPHAPRAAGRRALLTGAAALALLALAPRGLAPEAAAAEARRVVTLGAAITETAYAVGAGPEVVGVDASSTWPASARAVPQVGYHRQLSAEGVLSLAPTDVLCTDEAGPAAALSQLGAAGVRVHVLPAAHDGPTAAERVRRVGAILGRPAEAAAVAGALLADLESARQWVAGQPARPRVLFIYARGGGTVNVSGSGTAADAMIGLAGGLNAVTGFSGYRPLTPEAAVGAAPDVLLLTTHGVAGLGGDAAVWALPGIGLTPAARARALVTLDDVELLSFGPRAGAAVLRLAKALHPAPRP